MRFWVPVLLTYVAAVIAVAPLFGLWSGSVGVMIASVLVWAVLMTWLVTRFGWRSLWAAPSAIAALGGPIAWGLLAYACSQGDCL